MFSIQSKDILLPLRHCLLIGVKLPWAFESNIQIFLVTMHRINVPQRALATMLIFSLAFLSACSNKVLTRDNLRLDLLTAISSAAESEAFLEFVQQRRSTKSFAEGHLLYLSEQVHQAEQKLQGVSPAPGTEHALAMDRIQLESLSKELQNARQRIDDANALAASQQHIQNIRKQLEEARSSL